MGDRAWLPEAEPPPVPGPWGDLDFGSSSSNRHTPPLGLGTGGGFPPSEPHALYHLQFQQQRHLQHQHQHDPSGGFGFPHQPLPQQPPQGAPGGRFPPPLLPPPTASPFDLSQSLQQLRLSNGGGTSAGDPPLLSDPFAPWGAVGAAAVPSPLPATGLSLRDQMNQQMAALYQREHVGPSALSPHGLDPSGPSLLELLSGGGDHHSHPHHSFGDHHNSSTSNTSSVFPDLPDLSFSSQLLGGPTPVAMLPRPQQPQPPHPHLHPSPFVTHPHPHHSLQPPFGMNQQHPRLPQLMPTPGAASNPHSVRHVRRPPTPPPLPPPPLTSSNNTTNSFTGGRAGNDPASDLAGSSIEVAPDVTKPNGTIKVQVSLLADECAPGRVLMVGLFRLGQVTNERPIFVKQVLFENKLQRHYRFLNTRITFRAPRSPGDFEFRVFESSRPVGAATTTSSSSLDDREAQSATYSNATIARSNRLKVTMEYAHFIETLRATRDKFRSGLADGDAGAVMSSLLALLRLVDQVETVFLHGNALFTDFVDACLELVAMDEATVRRTFAPIESVPNPAESFHGTMRNVLNAIDANPFVKELVADDVLAAITVFQQDRYCQASGYYFPSPAARRAYWTTHFGFAPSDDDTDNDDTDDAGAGAAGRRLRESAFVRRGLSQWATAEARRLIPDKTAFRRARQAIYDAVYAHVVARLPVKADLDVFGSSANDFGTAESDMDMCLVLAAPSSANEKQQVLRLVVALLERQPHVFTAVDTSRLSARIPIVMFRMADTGAECDLSVENVLAQRNTSFLRAYANADARVRVLAYVLKRFVKRRCMNTPAEGTLSTYGYLLMLIHFLQRQDPPVVPVLQTLPPDWNGATKCACTPSQTWCRVRSPQCALSERHPEMHLPSVVCKGPTDDSSSSVHASASASPRFETYFFDPFGFPDPTPKLELLAAFGARNTASVGELLVGFFEYFGLRFDASREVVSVRMARPLSKDEKKREHQWRVHTRLSIEDPFEVAYDVAHVLKPTRDKYIRQQFARAFALLARGARDAARAENENANDREEDAVVRIMAELMEEVGEPPFLQPVASALGRRGGDRESAGPGDDGMTAHEDG